MTLLQALYYVLAGLAASLVVSALFATVVGFIGYWIARRDYAEVDRIVGDVPSVPPRAERDR